VSPGFTPIQTGFTPLTQSQLLLSGSSQFHATYSQITGQPTLTYSTTDTSVSDVSAAPPALVLAPAPEGVTGTGITELIPSSVASTDPLLVPATQTEPLVTTTQITTALESQGQPIGPLPPSQPDTETAEQTRTTLPTLPSSEGPTGSTAQPQPSPKSSPDDVLDQFIVAHRSPGTGSSVPPPPSNS
jgi:hypothetical protein